MELHEMILMGFMTTFVAFLIYQCEKQVRYEKKWWNNGLAPSGAKWELVSCDSQGGRAYIDPDGDTDRWFWVNNDVDYK